LLLYTITHIEKAIRGIRVTLKTYKLTIAANTVDPLLIARIQSGAVEAVISGDATVEVAGSKLLFADTAEALGPGTPVKVWLNRYFYCASLADLAADRMEHEAVQLAKEQKERERRNALRDEAAAFNAVLASKIPVQWCPGVKEVMSGLSASSWGDGRNRASVEHVYLLGDMQVGRLKRKVGDFLCANSNTRLGGLDPRSVWVDGDGQTYEPKITCKACLQVVDRLTKQ
jgi:hypothetical protein